MEEKVEIKPVEEVKEVPKEEVKEVPKDEAPKEEVKEAIKEEVVNEEVPKEEVKEALEEEVPKEEVKKEEVVEEKPVKKEEVSEKEDIKEEIKDTKEELAVIREVRDELVTLYAKYGDIEKIKEQLEVENGTLKENVETLNSQLKRYKDAEEKLAVKQKQERLEKLSAKFKVLGQEKSVEQLDKKDSETLDEFEKIVDAAIDKAGETKETPAETEQSQAEVLSEGTKSEEEKPSDVKAEVKQAPKKDFFSGLCDTLTEEQKGLNDKVKFM